jgi:hypothetical protein
MKKLLIILLFSSQVFAGDLEMDKIKHFGVAFGLTKGSIWLFEDGFRLKRTEAKIISSVLVLSLGIAKEYTDRKIDGGDLLADFLGVAAANLINIKIDF